MGGALRCLFWYEASPSRQAGAAAQPLVQILNLDFKTLCDAISFHCSWLSSVLSYVDGTTDRADLVILCR